MSALTETLADGAVVAKRNLIKIRRVPELLVFTTLSPIMFVLLFAYVFGGAISGGDPQQYREFLIAGIFAQTVVFGSTITGAGIAEDVQKGIIDRFRTLPMHPGAVLTGRTFSDLLNNVIVLIIMTLTGLAIGWRIRDGLLRALLAYALMLAFAYAISWVMAYIGLKVRAPEIFNNATFMIIFPLTFVANTFVPSENMPAVLRTIAGWNPVSTITHAARDNLGNLFALTPGGSADAAGMRERIEYTWALQHAEVYTIAWIVGLLLVFVPLSIRTYQRSVAR